MAALALASAPAASAAGTSSPRRDRDLGRAPASAPARGASPRRRSPTPALPTPALPFARPTVPGMHRQDHPRARVRARRRAGSRSRGDLGRRQDPVQALLYAGGHGQWNDFGYDCSGTVSYVLHAAGLINESMDSGEMMSWGQRRRGPVGDDLHQPRARVHPDRGDPARHLGRAGPEPALRAPARAGGR